MISHINPPKYAYAAGVRPRKHAIRTPSFKAPRAKAHTKQYTYSALV